LKGEKRREMEKQMASLRKDLGIKEGKGEVDWDELEKVMDGDFDEDEWQRVVGKMLEARDDDVSFLIIHLQERADGKGGGRGRR
jgi:protein KRI1